MAATGSGVGSHKMAKLQLPPMTYLPAGEYCFQLYYIRFGGATIGNLTIYVSQSCGYHSYCCVTRPGCLGNLEQCLAQYRRVVSWARTCAAETFACQVPGARISITIASSNRNEVTHTKMAGILKTPLRWGKI